MWLSRSKISTLPKRYRKYTPVPFARYLLEGVLRRYGPGEVAVLWVSRQTNYTHLLFREFGDGLALERIDQCLYGHPMRKRTLPYWV